MGDTDKDTPRHFKAGGPGYLDIAFEEPLPDNALPNIWLNGPLDGPYKGQSGIMISGGRSPQPGSPDPRKLRITGQINANTPPGTYKVTQITITWAPGSPASWPQQNIDFSHLQEDLTIIVDRPDAPPPPSIPKLTDLD